LLETLETRDSKEKAGADLTLSALREMPTLQGTTGTAAGEDGIYQRAVGIDLFKVSAGVGVAAAVLVPNFVEARQRGQLTACRSNLRNIATGLEMYETDHNGLPKELQALTPDYLKYIPECPAAGMETYSRSYRKKDGDFTLYCSGSHHPDLGENKPNYSEE